jgi:hypothetical protein
VDQLIKKKERKIVKAFLKYIEKVYYHVQEYVLIRINDVWNDDYTEDHTKKKKGRGPTKIKKKNEKNEKLKAFFFSCQGLIFFFFYDCWALRLGNVFLKNN